MTRRHLLALLSVIGLVPRAVEAQGPSNKSPGAPAAGPTVEPLHLPDAEWRKKLTPEQYAVLRQEGTERPGSSPLNQEKRKGRFNCAGCDLPLFSSETKFESGTGWPSFYAALPGALGTKTDLKLILPRTEYHCARCEGHQGHIFNDGPKPTGLRYCMNGLAMNFRAA